MRHLAFDYRPSRNELNLHVDEARAAKYHSPIGPFWSYTHPAYMRRLTYQCSLCEQNSSFANMYTAETYFTRGLEVNSHPLHLKKSDFASSRFLSLFYNT